MPVNAGIIGIVENEAVFVALDSEVEFNGQPCGMIVAKTMAAANSAAAKVEITYEKSQIDRPIIPTLRHWHETNELSKCRIVEEHRIPPNQQFVRPLVGQEQKVRGKMTRRKSNFSRKILN